jgi:hypothetical protein
MIKSTIVKWAVAAVLAAPAIPTFGTTIHHHRLVARNHSHRLVTTNHHRVVTKTHRHVTLSTHRKLTTHRHLTHSLTHKSGTRHASMTSTSHFKVHVTKMPPTIDGINT